MEQLQSNNDEPDLSPEAEADTSTTHVSFLPSADGFGFRKNLGPEDASWDGPRPDDN